MKGGEIKREFSKYNTVVKGKLFFPILMGIGFSRGLKGGYNCNFFKQKEGL
jgi:hypothetical protein